MGEKKKETPEMQEIQQFHPTYSIFLLKTPAEAKKGHITES